MENTKTSEVIVVLDGLAIKTNSLYQIQNKPDPNAPSGFVEEGTTKLPSIGIGETIPCRFVESSKNTGAGIFDTGLFPQSPMYATRDKREVEEIIGKLNTFIVEPYERLHGEGILDHKNIEFWSSYGVNLYEKRMFNTSNPTDLLDLLIAVTSFNLTPKGQEGHPKYRGSAYIVVDKDNARSIDSTRANDFIDAVSGFGTLLSTNRTLLLGILRYAGLQGVTKDIKDDTLKPLFNDWVKSSNENTKTFLSYVARTEKSEGRDEIMLFSKLYDLALKHTIKKDPMGSYYYNDTTLGTDLKSAAKNLAYNPELEEIKIAIQEL